MNHFAPVDFEDLHQLNEESLKELIAYLGKPCDASQAQNSEKVETNSDVRKRKTVKKNRRKNPLAPSLKFHEYKMDRKRRKLNYEYQAKEFDFEDSIYLQETKFVASLGVICPVEGCSMGFPNKSKLTIHNEKIHLPPQIWSIYQ